MDLVEQRPGFDVSRLQCVGVDALIDAPLLANRLGDLKEKTTRMNSEDIYMYACMHVLIDSLCMLKVMYTSSNDVCIDIGSA